MSQSIFRWESMRERGPHILPFKEPLQGVILEVELTSNPVVNVFRADDRAFYFCHGLTFGGKDAPGGPVSPFSGRDVLLILENHFRLLSPEATPIAGDILVWTGPSDETPHSAILTGPVVTPKTSVLDYASVVRTKNGKLPEATMALEKLVDGPESYGEYYRVYRRKELEG
jgi:hypothetical protein